MFHIFISLISIFICYKFGDWRNWHKYYPTILFFILSNTVYILLTYNHPLWQYEWALLPKIFSDLLICITVYPSTIMVFFSHFPKKLKRIIPYITFYVAVYTIVEFISINLGYFSYHNGWNIWNSVIFNYLMFPLLILHYKNPLYAWMVAFISPHLLFFLLKIPYSCIR